MSTRGRLALLGCLAASCLLASAHAQEAAQAPKHGGPRYNLQRALKAKRSGKTKEKLAEEEPPPPPVDAALAAALGAKIELCYEAETGRKLAEPDRALVHEYRDALVRELQPGYRTTGCEPEEPSTPQCLDLFAKLTCEELAEGIKARRWDKHILPEERAMLTRYMTALVQRKAQCSAARGADKDPVELQVEADRLSVVATMNITVGRCQLDPKGEPGCAKLLAATSCANVERAAMKNRLLELCPDFLPCGAGPGVE